MAISVNQTSSAVDAMAKNWPVVASLMGGTVAMRAAREAYMPKQPREDREDYDYRLSTATLFPAYSRTVGVMTGKPFSKELALNDDTPDVILALSQDIDGEGRSLHAFAADVMQEAMSFGFGGILVDFTRTEGANRTKADDKAMNARPYWVHVKRSQVLGWKVGKVNGVSALVQLRIAEFAEVDDGDYGVKSVSRVRVLTPGAFELWEAAANGTYAIVDRGLMAPLKSIPFVPIYGKRVGFMNGAPPLLDLAHQNVKHWQQQSDQDDSARFARKRLLVLIGADDDATTMTAGNYAWRLPAGGDAKVVQGSAESVTVGRTELEALEAQMIQTGAELLTAKPGSRTATEASNDAEANKSDLQRIVETFEDSIDQALQFTADWLGLPEGGHCALYKDFSASTLTDASAQLVLSMQQGGLLSKATSIREMQRRGAVSPDVVPEDELGAVDEEGPALGGIGTGDGGGAD